MARQRGMRMVGTNHFLPNNWSNNLYIPRSVQGVVHKAMWYNMLEVFNQLDAATTPTETAVAILRKQDIRIPVKAISCGVNQDEFYPQPALDPASCAAAITWRGSAGAAVRGAGRSRKRA